MHLVLVLALAAQLPTLTPRDSAFYALNRLAYGARPAEADSVARFGVMRWIERQLDPDHVSDDHLGDREREFKILDYIRADLAGRYRDATRERQRLQREAGATGDSTRMRDARPMQEFRELGGELQQLAIVRAALSERQLREVMVDFWTNHFNVFVGKGADRFLLPSYIEETIRPRALGNFEDLLIATARSPAMLFYLDNAQSVAPGSAPPRPFMSPFRRRPFGMNETNKERQQRQRRQPTGINENYARELLELHTLGVDGGYTQQDVINVARIFTGWSIERPERGAGVEPDDTPRFALLVARLGEPLYQQPAPTGYAETEEHWVNSGALLARMNAAVAIAKDCSSVPAIDDHARLVDTIDQKLLGGTMSAHTRSVILEQIADLTDPEQARGMAVGLALGGPDFQKQ